MNLNTFSKTTLLLGSAALLMACSADDNGKTITDTAQVVKTQTVEKSSYKMIEYKTCLLYTSPSPRDLSTSRMPSSA